MQWSCTLYTVEWVALKENLLLHGVPKCHSGCPVSGEAPVPPLLPSQSWLPSEQGVVDPCLPLLEATAGRCKNWAFSPTIPEHVQTTTCQQHTLTISSGFPPCPALPELLAPAGSPSAVPPCLAASAAPAAACWLQRLA